MNLNRKEIGYGKSTIADVFSLLYTVPSYQRHYVWEQDNINDLLSDFEDNYLAHCDEEYFLGSYVIQNKGFDHDILDGQQRITTLFLLFAFLRDYEESSDNVKYNCQDLIYQKGNTLKGIPERVRIGYDIRNNVRMFIDEYLVHPGSITDNWAEILEMSVNCKESMTIQRMCSALCCFRKYFTERPWIDLERYVSFILRNVVMIYVSADSLEVAFRLFSIMNDRGMRLCCADILKASNLEAIDNDIDRNCMAQQWEDMQANLGIDFDRFLSYVRTMLLRKRQQSSLLDEYERIIFSEGILAKGKPFFSYVYKAYKDYCTLILLEGNEDKDYRSLIRILLKCMPSSDWIPVVMQYYRNFKRNHLCEFTFKIACKYIADAVCGKATSQRIDNLNRILVAMEDATSAENMLDNNSLFSFDHNLFLTHISGDVYGRRYTIALLMLLEYKYSDKTEWKDFGKITIEHILPRNPTTDSQWCRDFNDIERKNLTNRIGNLCLIGRAKNLALGNLDYRDKIDRYFSSGIGSFAYTQRLYHKYPDRWGVAEINDNQRSTIHDLCQIFGIDLTDQYFDDKLANSGSIFHATQSAGDPSISNDSYILEQRKRYPNAYKLWNEEMDSKLKSIYFSGASMREMTTAMGRNEGGIIARLKRLLGTEDVAIPCSDTEI